MGPFRGYPLNRLLRASDEAVRFDFERMSRVKRRGGRLRQISVEVADRAGFEPTSPAPKAGRISRLP